MASPYIFVTMTKLECLIDKVFFLMYYKVTFMGKGLVTMITLIWLFPRDCYLMTNKLTFLSKGFVTMAFLPNVFFDVLLEHVSV